MVKKKNLNHCKNLAQVILQVEPPNIQNPNCSKIQSFLRSATKPYMDSFTLDRLRSNPAH